MHLDPLKFISKGQILGIAVSGGADSMALLHLFSTYAKTYDFNVLAINVEHGIRGKDSLNDTEFVKNYCNENNIPLKTFSVDCLSFAKNNKISVEQAARTLRYDCFKQVLDENLCTRIATAHHAGDNAETILINLFRGSSLKGLAGIKPETERFVRPLLSFSKEDVLCYVAQNNIPYVTDQTNFDEEITRNAIRHTVLPAVHKLFPEAEKCITRFSSIALEEDCFLDNLAKKLIIRGENGLKISISDQKVLMRRATVMAIKMLGIAKDYTFTHVESIIHLAELENGSKTSLPNNLTAVKEYDYIAFYTEKEKPLNEIPFGEGTFCFPYGILKVEKATPPVDFKNGFYCDGDKIPQNAVIRTRHNGDVFIKFGGSKTKLKKYFIDEKIPVMKRDFIPLIAKENQIFFTGISISNNIKVDKTTKNMLKLTYTNTKE